MRVYNDLAWLWRSLSPPQDYAAEAEAVRRIIQYALGMRDTAGCTLLDLGSGAGHTLHLLPEFIRVAVDLSAPMLSLSEELNPGVEHHLGDMRGIRLGRQFDAVLIQDAVDHMAVEEDAAAAVATGAAHCRPGGVVVVAPTYTAETFEDHQSSLDSRAINGLQRLLISHVARDPASPCRFHLSLTMAIRRDGRLIIEQDRQVCGLFTSAAWRQMMEDAGLQIVDLPGELRENMPSQPLAGRAPED